ncbi:hypothetical protein BEP19_12520 [Ammoniphilus oxalaticus]|uniref:Sporulation protein n=1 Tax=Ammoniphilus oxalaticus TaxID=66863 RepID=A0A419SGZ0_9BACL|nr:hypothetical protein [Ammoniphilus oxalaticus]RKD23043.1 hypothetical protein BEP19_12520 [Ammoniphilus oxalaticus]
MQKKSFAAPLLCLALSVMTACSSGLGYDDRPHQQRVNSYGARDYTHQTGAYDHGPGYNNDFQPADMNPTLITGTNDLYNVSGDAQIMADLASTVPGVKAARAQIIGGTAHVKVRIAKGADALHVRQTVLERVEKKMPRYQINVKRMFGVGVGG